MTDHTDYEYETCDYDQARAPRHDHGCPACGAPIEPTKSREVWPQHIVHGQSLADGKKCGLSGCRIGPETDAYFGTFFDRDHPRGFPENEGYQITTRLEPFGNAIGLVNTLELPDSATRIQVTSRITKADYPRLRDELDRYARSQGWPVHID